MPLCYSGIVANPPENWSFYLTTNIVFYYGGNVEESSNLDGLCWYEIYLANERNIFSNLRKLPVLCLAFCVEKSTVSQVVPLSKYNYCGDVILIGIMHESNFITCLQISSNPEHDHGFLNHFANELLRA